MGQLHRLGRPLHFKNELDPSTITDKESNKVKVERNRSYTRFVFMSDTHGYHRFITPLPKGDVLIHTGDICGNYSKSSDILEQFEDFLNFIEEIHRDFSQIVFIAGNHDKNLEMKGCALIFHLINLFHANRKTLLLSHFQQNMLR